jgi:trimeric autotransporter adhesin
MEVLMLRPLTGALLGLLLASAPAVAQSAFLVRDINTTRYGSPGPDTGPLRDLHAAGDKLFFVGPVSGGGEEVWVSDGTAQGTEALRDICPGVCEDYHDLLGNLGNLMLWTTSRGGADQLWRSDGTRPGTFALTDERADVGTPAVGAFFHGAYYFAACSGGTCGLWQTDGSAAGTRVFHERLSLNWVIVAGDRLFYLARTGEGADLWATDSAGTVLLRRFEGIFDHPEAPAAAGGRLFFQATGDGRELWTSDGTPAGTRPLTSFNPPDPFEGARWLKPAGNRVYFVADDGLHAREIWRSDGTSAGTVRVTELDGEAPFLHESPGFLEEIGGRLVFEAFVDGTPSRLWTTQGTPGSTAPFLLPCGDCELYSRLVLSGGKLFFLTEEGLWSSDGTPSGSRLLEQVCPHCGSADLVPWHGGILFMPDDFQDPEIWFSDGTVEGTRPLTSMDGEADFAELAELGGRLYFLAESDDSLGEPGGLWSTNWTGPQDTRAVFILPVNGPGSDPGRLTFHGGRLFFTAWDGDIYDLWSTSGTPESTSPLNDGEIVFWPDSTSELVPAAGLLFFLNGRQHEEHDLWRTDGTPQGTFALAHLPAETVLMPFQGSLYFFNGPEIWKTDGTLQGTVKTGDLPEGLSRAEFAAAGPNGIYLATRTGIWLTDGTGAGTRQLTNFSGGGEDPELTVVGAFVYFLEGGRIWRTDGTPGGTVALELPPSGSYPTRLTSHQGALYYFLPGLSLWRTDGTVAGTVQLGAFPDQDTYYFPVELQPFNGKLYFNVDDGIHGIELWVTDGTAAGTVMVADLLPDQRSSAPTQLTAAGGRLFFSAGDDVHGIELWQSDGTAAGTRIVQDIAPQAASSRPTQLTVAGDHLYFTADDGLSGRELWTVPLAAPSGCKPSPTRLCLNGGRYAVEAAWRDFQDHRGIGQAVSLTADTGYFWFFNEANVEVVLKVLDGSGVNGHVWVFYGALSTVEFTLTVTDTQTGISRRYVNPSGQLASVGDTRSFGSLGAASRSTVAAGICEPSPTRLCLNGDRFAVEATWKDFQGNAGVGKAVELTADTGYFWFFNQENVEVVLKVLNGLPVNGYHWVFYGALSSVEYTLTVTDTMTGAVKTYKNPSGSMASVADTGAFIE